MTPSAIEAAFRGLEWSPASRARAITALREWLAPHHPPSRSPVDLDRPAAGRAPAGAPAVAGATRRRWSTAPGARRSGRRRSAEALALRDRALMEVLYGSGLRRQEACDLVLAGLDFEHESLRVVGKGGRARTVPLTEPAVAALRAWLSVGRPRLVAGRPPQAATRAPVFVSRSGRALDGSTVYRVVARELRAAGRAGGPHLLRHAAGTHLLEGPGGRDGAHLRVVQEVLGHASLATTQRYTGVTTKSMQAALRRGHPRG